MKTPASPPSPPPYHTTLAQLAREVAIETFRSGGPGGQHRNVTESAVRLLHHPSGVEVIASDFRSQHRNRALAFERLIARLRRLNRVPAKRIPTRVSARAVEKRLEAKRRRQRAKRGRGAVREDQ